MRPNVQLLGCLSAHPPRRAAVGGRLPLGLRPARAVDGPPLRGVRGAGPGALADATRGAQGEQVGIMTMMMGGWSVGGWLLGHRWPRRAAAKPKIFF